MQNKIVFFVALLAIAGGVHSLTQTEMLENEINHVTVALENTHMEMESLSSEPDDDAIALIDFLEVDHPLLKADDDDDEDDQVEDDDSNVDQQEEEEDLEEAPAKEEKEKLRKPIHVASVLGNEECAKCQYQRYRRCFQVQAENALDKSTDVFPTCDRDAQQRCQVHCWDTPVAVDSIRERVWKNEDLCSACMSFQIKICESKWQTEEDGSKARAACRQETTSKCRTSGWCTKEQQESILLP